MNALDAAAKILRKAGQPLHVKKIAKRMIDTGLWPTQGKTPDSTVGARLYSDIKKKGKRSRFYKDKPNTFGMRDLKITKSQKSGKQQKGISFVECGQKVLEESGGNEPMHYKEITKIALEKGWLSTEGRTPDATMRSAIYSDIRRRQYRGEIPLFVQHDRGYIGLSQKIESKLKSTIERHNSKTKENLLKQLHDMEPRDFEGLITKLLICMGFEDVEQTSYGKDQGIDVRGTLVIGNVVRIKMAVQAKKWRDNVQRTVVQQVRGSLKTHEQGLIITTSGFSRGAITEAEDEVKRPVALMNGEQLLALLVEHEISVHRSKLDLLEIDEEH